MVDVVKIIAIYDDVSSSQQLNRETVTGKKLWCGSQFMLYRFYSYKYKHVMPVFLISQVEKLVSFGDNIIMIFLVFFCFLLNIFLGFFSFSISLLFNSFSFSTLFPFFCFTCLSYYHHLFRNNK